MKSGNNEEVITSFESLIGYKDSEDEINSSLQSLQTTMEETISCSKKVDVDSTMIFKKYENDNNSSNGSEEIE